MKSGNKKRGLHGRNEQGKKVKERKKKEDEDRMG